jgi:aminoglycoside phosphotransferase (APT) family kinase protein
VTAAASGEAAQAEHLVAQLVSLLAEQLPDARDIEVTNLTRSGAGTSRENWSFDATWTISGERAERRLLLRRDPPAAVVDSDRESEQGLLQALGPADVPTPMVLWADLASHRLGRPFMVMERSPGSTDRNILTERNPLGLDDDARLSLAHQYCDLLADVHRVDVDALGLGSVLGPPPADVAGAQVARWDAVIGSDALEPQPELAYVSHWLRANVPSPPTRTALVHGDYRPANALVDAGRITVLLDWEFAHLGDSLEDVGWYCTPLYRGEHFIPAMWQEDDFLRRYSARAGIDIDRAALRFWKVLAMYKLSALALTGIRIFVEGRTDRPAAPVDRLLRAVVGATLQLARSEDTAA